jgi:hypothetical protein
VRHPRFVSAKWHKFWGVREYHVEVSGLGIDEFEILGFSNGFFFGLGEGGNHIFGKEGNK